METEEDALWDNFYEKTQTDAKLVKADFNVQEIDDGFFEKFGDQLKLAAEPTPEIEEEETRKREEYQLEPVSRGDETSTLSDSHGSSTEAIQCKVEDLFCDVYYQCTHLVGQESGGIKKDALMAYLKDLFGFDDAKCTMLTESIEQRPAPKMMLKVDVCEAKDLSPKDANGSSDPFCTLWISSSQATRFSTSMMKQTLNPIWDEHFKIPVSSPTNDVLYVEVWDFDEADTFGNKITKIGEVKGFKGVRKMFKEVVQTISPNNHDNELIGAVQVTLKNIPVTGQMTWFPLRKKSNAKSGVIRLKMMFGSEKDERVALEEHRYLVKTLLVNLTKNSEFDLTTWNGLFGHEGELILRQHLAQSNIGITEDLVAKLVEYVSLHQTRPMNFSILADVFGRLTTTLKTVHLIEEEITLYWNTVRKLLPSCFNYIRKIRKSAPGDKNVLIQLDAILSILSDLSNMSIPSDVTLFLPQMQNTDKFSIESMLHEVVLHGACDWFEYLVSHNKPENSTDEAILKHLVKITQLINLDLQGAKTHNEILFKERLNFPYSKTLFTVYQTNLVEIIGDTVTNICTTMKPLDFEKRNENDANNDSLTTGTTMFELFLILQNIYRTGAELFHNDDALETFVIRKYYTWFSTVVVTWLDIAAYKAVQRIEKAVQLDDFVPVDSTVQYSSSAIDTMAIFHQVKTFWDQLAWPDVEGSYTFIAKIIDDICKSSVQYADQIASKVDGMRLISNACETKFEVTSEWCVAINNIDYIHHGIEPFIRDLGLDKLFKSLEEFNNAAAAEHCKQTLERVIENAVESVANKIVELLEILVNKMEPSIMSCLLDGAELHHQQNNILDKLMQYLDGNLMTLNLQLTTENFNRVLELIWIKLSDILSQLVKSGIERRRPPSYFSILQETLKHLISFFRIERKEEEHKLNTKMANVERILTIYGTETPELIHQYHLQRLAEQNEIDKSEDGQMAITLQIDGDELSVEILNAQNIRPMDSNGQSDPFVSIRFLPKHKFASIPKQMTKVQKKTLFPLFDEKFTFLLTPEQSQVKHALIQFVMKDQDFCGAKNDYMAEALVLIEDAGDARTAGPYPKQLHLKLNRPKNADSDILMALDYRQGDKMARDFVKKQKARMDVPH